MDTFHLRLAVSKTQSIILHQLSNKAALWNNAFYNIKQCISKV